MWICVEIALPVSVSSRLKVTADLQLLEDVSRLSQVPVASVRAGRLSSFSSLHATVANNTMTMAMVVSPTPQ